ncbi:SPOSA6832_00219 [Sporobolomyces salmonicolor]|uniref:SPOSA6832_00219-mRNA-1:cds n=1 Tax=Sporidiobolus salmonicolor TaxID=5005 RepID=A0A0D6EFU3_SPOSA|nr:SPOSA6832_00219 [Sporobolomyces salmonicolor]
MVRLARFLGLITLTSALCVSATPLEFIQSAGSGLVSAGLRNIFRLNETQIASIVQGGDKPLPPHPYALDLTDENWQTALATGTEDNPFAIALPDDNIWVVTVYGPDAISKAYAKAMDEVAMDNSSAAGGDLPVNMRFARLSYGRETVLPTRWWLWRPPVIVIGTNNMQDLRFILTSHMRPHAASLCELLSKPEIWEKLPVWEGSLAPGGKFEPYLAQVAEVWARFHKATSRIPNVVLLMISGFLMNIVLGWLHGNGKKPAARPDAGKAKSDSSNTAPTAVGPKASATGGITSSGSATKKGTKRK